jgi:DNA-binding NarL/FixJ family response regulator
VFRRLRLIDPEAAVVLTSGFSEPDQLKSMLDDGLLGFLPKPFAKNKLLTNVRSALDRAAARSAGPVAA